MPRIRLDPEVRKADLLDVAIKMAETIGYERLTRCGIAKKANVSEALVSNYWGTMAQLRRAVMRAAIARNNLKIIAQGLAIHDAMAHKVPDAIKNQAAATLSG